MLSRISGFARDVCIAAYLGSGFFSDAYFLGLRLANFFRRIFTEGNFQGAFIPLFQQLRLEAERVKLVWYASLFLLIVLVPLTVLGEIFMPSVVTILAPEFPQDKQELTILLARIMLPYLPMMGLWVVLASLLNIRGRFGATAFSPVLVNMTILALFAATVFGLFGSAGPTQRLLSILLSVAVIVGGLFQIGHLWIVLIASSRNSQVDAAVHTDGQHDSDADRACLKRLVLRMLPLMASTAVLQAVFLLDSYLVAQAGSGVLSALYYAERVSQLPLAVVGATLAVVILPKLSRAVARAEPDQSRATVKHALWLAVLFSLPAFAGIFVLSEPLADGLFRRGALSRDDTMTIASVLEVFAFVLPGAILAKTLMPIWLSEGKTYRAMQLTFVVAGVNAVGSISLFYTIGYLGVPMASGIAFWLQAAILLLVSSRRKLLPTAAHMVAAVLLTATATVVMAVVLVPLEARFPYDASSLMRIGALLMCVAIGAATYFSVIFTGLHLRKMLAKMREGARRSP